MLKTALLACLLLLEACSEAPAPAPMPGELVLDPEGPRFVITPITLSDGTRCVVARRIAIAIACEFPQPDNAPRAHKR
jgi:hypothetical protein